MIASGNDECGGYRSPASYEVGSQAYYEWLFCGLGGISAEYGFDSGVYGGGGGFFTPIIIGGGGGTYTQPQAQAQTQTQTTAQTTIQPQSPIAQSVNPIALLAVGALAILMLIKS